MKGFAPDRRKARVIEDHGLDGRGQALGKREFRRGPLPYDHDLPGAYHRPFPVDFVLFSGKIHVPEHQEVFHIRSPALSKGEAVSDGQASFPEPVRAFPGLAGGFGRICP